MEIIFYYFSPFRNEWCNNRYRDNSVNSTNHSPANNLSAETGYSSDSKQQSPHHRRVRKYSPGVSAVVRRATGNKSSRRRPGRPKKDGQRKRSKKLVNFNGLDLLHAQTVLSITNSAKILTEAAPGCVDQSLNSVQKFEDCYNTSYKTSYCRDTIPAKENIYLKSESNENVQLLNESHNSSVSLAPSDSPSPSSLTSSDSLTSINTIDNVFTPQPDPKLMKSVSSAVDALCESYKRQYMNYFAYLQTPQAKIALKQQIHDEKNRNTFLTSQIDILQRTVNSLIQRGVHLLKSRLGELDIVASNSDELVNKAKEILARNKELQEQVNSLQDQVNYLDNLNGVLKKNKSVEALLSMMNQTKSSVKENSRDRSDKSFTDPKSINTYNNLIKRSSLAPGLADKRFSRLDNIRLDDRPNIVQEQPPVAKTLSQLCNNNVIVPPQDTSNSRDHVTNTFDDKRQMNIEDRVNSMIVEALNEKPPLPHPTNDDKSIKKDSRTKSLPKVDPAPKPNKFFHRPNRDKSMTGVRLTKGSQHASIVAKINNKPSEPDNQSLIDSRDAGSKDKYAWSPHHISKDGINASSLSSPKVTSVNCSVNNGSPSEDKKPILLTFKLDRRKNGAIVTSPAHLPDKSPANRTSREESSAKRKNSSPENAKKSRYAILVLILFYFVYFLKHPSLSAGHGVMHFSNCLAHLTLIPLFFQISQV